MEPITEKIFVRTAQKEIGPFTLEELAQRLATGEVKELSPARLESEESSRALKFHPIYEQVTKIEVTLPKEDKKAAKVAAKKMYVENGFKPESKGNVKALVIILLLIALIPIGKFGTGLLKSGKASKEADAFNVAFSTQVKGDPGGAMQAYLNILADEKNVEDEALLYKCRTHLAVIILEKGNTSGAFNQVKKVPNGVANPNADTEFARYFADLFSKKDPNYMTKYQNHRKKHPDHYPGLVADTWLYAGNLSGFKANPAEQKLAQDKIGSLYLNAAESTDTADVSADPNA